MLKKLFKSIREYQKPTIVGMVFMFFEAMIECAIPFILAQLVNEISATANMEEILKYGTLLFFLSCLSLLAGVFASKLTATAGTGFAKNLRKDIFYKIQDFSFDNIDYFSHSSLVTRLTSDISNVQMAFTMGARMIVRTPLMLIFSFIMAFYMGGKLAFVFVLIIPILLVGAGFLIRFAMPLFKKVFKKYDKLNESVQENISGVRVVKSFVREDYEIEKFNDASSTIARELTKANRIMALSNPITQTCIYAILASVLGFGSKMIITSQGSSLNIGQLSSLITYGMQIFMALMMMAMIAVMVTMSLESARRIVEVLDTNSTMTNIENCKKEINDGSIDFNHVNFKYAKNADNYVLSDIDLHIKSGETIGIIGGTGSGKSSLISLIPRLYDVTEGQVKVGNIDVKEMEIEALRDKVGVVLQKNLIFKGTILDNLRWGNKEATLQQCIEACKLAQAHDFIMEMPDQYNTIIEQGGTNVSGGQKQRLCIARALLKKPQILIFDDSTSAVDTKTDALIRKGLYSYLPNTTKIIIAQRISSIEEADRIVVMDKGRINAVGTHQQLLETNEIYKEVYDSQTKSKEATNE